MGKKCIDIQNDINRYYNEIKEVNQIEPDLDIVEKKTRKIQQKISELQRELSTCQK